MYGLKTGKLQSKSENYSNQKNIQIYLIYLYAKNKYVNKSSHSHKFANITRHLLIFTPYKIKHCKIKVINSKIIKYQFRK